MCIMGCGVECVCVSVCMCDQMHMHACLSVTKNWCGWMYVHVSIHYYMHHNYNCVVEWCVHKHAWMHVFFLSLSTGMGGCMCMCI